jgi:hypothetical protein
VKDNPAQALWSLSIYLQKGAAMLVRYFSRYCDHATQAILFTLLVLLNGVVCAEPVKIESGMVQGTIEDGLYVYRGIPYAAPPLGDLRWRAPQTAPKWQGVLAANAFGRACIQSNPAIVNLPAPSEDCLYLNIWTPIKHAEKRLPVMVWIHGGGFIAGATAEQLYHGEHIAKKGVIVVTIGYRLGILGFLAHPDLNAENDRHVSGNYGLLDMIAALRWVQRNISAFGGDPKRVTIFGESAGGIAVSMLCASPLAKELFHGAISQSGGSFGPVRAGGGPGENVQSLADGERAGETWALKAGVSNLSEMRRLPPDKLVTAGPGGGVAWPIMDGWIVPDDQYKLYQAGRYNDTPTLVGYNSDEGVHRRPTLRVCVSVMAVSRKSCLRSIRPEKGLSRKLRATCSATRHLDGTLGHGAACNRKQASRKRSSIILTIIRSIPQDLPRLVSVQLTATKCLLSFSSLDYPDVRRRTLQIRRCRK